MTVEARSSIVRTRYFSLGTFHLILIFIIFFLEGGFFFGQLVIIKKKKHNLPSITGTILQLGLHWLLVVSEMLQAINMIFNHYT